MNQKFETVTEGSVKYSDVLPGDIVDQLGDYQNSNWYQRMNEDKQAQVDEIVSDIAQNYNTGKINYSLDKGPSQPWNLLLGTNYELTKNWQFRAEVGFIGRFSIFGNINYRFKL